MAHFRPPLLLVSTALLVVLLAGCFPSTNPSAPAAQPTAAATVSAAAKPASSTAPTVAVSPVAGASPVARASPVVAASPAVAVKAATSGARKSAKLTLNFLAGGPQAGFMYAKKLGYYDQAGVDLTIEEGQGSATTAQLVATGGTQLGYSDAPSVMQVRSKGGADKIVAVILQTNAFAIISLQAKNITKPTDLVGKTLAVQPGTAQTALLDAVFAANNLDQKQVNVVNLDPSALVGSLLQGSVDAILAGADFQSVQIRDRGAQINELFYRDIGIPTVGLSVVANDNLIQSDPDLVRNFVAASLRGWDAARQHPDEAAQAVVEQFVSGDKNQILQQLQVDLQFMCAPGADKVGMPPDKNWPLTFDLLTKYGLLPADKPVTEYYTNQFIPQDAPVCPK